jgi:homoserine O-succinyltransferase
LALVNNMPDLALVDTEVQFCELLSAAAGDLPVLLRLFSLPGIARGEQGRQHLMQRYEALPELLASRFDGLIMTGTEPHQPDLRKEPYWDSLCHVLSWAQESTSSAILSCLAAHAGVLHGDGIPREALPEKRCGVFAFETAREHFLTGTAGARWSSPHSRWNEVRAGALTACGYCVLTQSSEAGVDLFVRQRRKSLFVHFQGHPEYDRLALFKEYRRDVRRFLKQEKPNYPSMPCAYFDDAAVCALEAFKLHALASRNERTMGFFPEALVMKRLENTWRARAVGMYRRWLEYAAACRSQLHSVPASSAELQPVGLNGRLRLEADVLSSN